MNLEKRVSRLEEVVPPSLNADEFFTAMMHGRIPEHLFDAYVRSLSDADLNQVIEKVEALMGEAGFQELVIRRGRHGA